MWEEREQKNWHKEDPVEEKCCNLDIDVLKMYKMRNPYCRYNFKDLGSVRRIKKILFRDTDVITTREKKATLMKAFPSGKRNGMDGGAK